MKSKFNEKKYYVFNAERDDEQRADNFYESTFKKFNETSKKISWNWPAFLLGPYWFMYRRMYIMAVFINLSQFAKVIFYRESELFNVLFIVMMVLSGIFGNYLYYWWIQRQIYQQILPPQEVTDMSTFWRMSFLSIFCITDWEIFIIKIGFKQIAPFIVYLNLTGLILMVAYLLYKHYRSTHSN